MVLWFALAVAFAQEKSAFERQLEAQQGVETKERWTSIGGVRYREVEYQGEKYYIQFKSRDGKESDRADLSCGRVGSGDNPQHVETGFQVTKRMRAFVQFLKETCVTRNGRDHMEVQLDPRIGFTLPDDPKAIIKNKKVYVTPAKVPGVGFSGEW